MAGSVSTWRDKNNSRCFIWCRCFGVNGSFSELPLLPVPLPPLGLLRSSSNEAVWNAAKVEKWNKTKRKLLQIAFEKGKTTKIYWHGPLNNMKLYFQKPQMFVFFSSKPKQSRQKRERTCNKLRKSKNQSKCINKIPANKYHYYWSSSYKSIGENCVRNVSHRFSIGCVRVAFS